MHVRCGLARLACSVPAVRQALDTGDRRMLCPVCKTVNLAMADRQGIEIDYCLDCRGVWLDRGELDRLIERAEPSAPLAAAATTPSYDPRPYPPAHDHRHGHKHGRKRHKSLLGELFDF
jgi:Zn-finger nucleic acid-binding protein